MDVKTRERLSRPRTYGNGNGNGKGNGSGGAAAAPPMLSLATRNPSVEPGEYASLPPSSALRQQDEGDANGGRRKSSLGTSRRYYATVDDGMDWPPELVDYNHQFAKMLEGIKRRHDGVVTTIGERKKKKTHQTSFCLFYKLQTHNIYIKHTICEIQLKTHLTGG